MASVVEKLHPFAAAQAAGREPFKVKNLAEAEFGRKEIRLAEQEMPGLMALRKQINDYLPEDEKISVNDFIIKAVALSLREFPNLVQNFSKTLTRADAAFDSMKLASDRASLNLDNLANFTKPLGERGPQLVDNLYCSLSNINELL